MTSMRPTLPPLIRPVAYSKALQQPHCFFIRGKRFAPSLVIPHLVKYDDIAVFAPTVFGNPNLAGTDSLNAGNPRHCIFRRPKVGKFLNKVHGCSTPGQLPDRSVFNVWFSGGLLFHDSVSLLQRSSAPATLRRKNCSKLQSHTTDLPAFPWLRPEARRRQGRRRCPYVQGLFLRGCCTAAAVSQFPLADGGRSAFPCTASADRRRFRRAPHPRAAAVSYAQPSQPALAWLARRQSAHVIVGTAAVFCSSRRTQTCLRNLAGGCYFAKRAPPAFFSTERRNDCTM